MREEHTESVHRLLTDRDNIAANVQISLELFYLYSIGKQETYVDRVSISENSGLKPSKIKMAEFPIGCGACMVNVKDIKAKKNPFIN